MANTYSFDEQLIMSNGDIVSNDVSSILLQYIPGALSVIKSSPENDRQGVDYWVEMNTARHLAVDVKVRQDDWLSTHPKEDDIALESWSVVEKNIVGWTRDTHKRCDYILWVWKSTGRFCLIPFPMLCHVFINKWQDWSKKYKTRKQFTPSSDGGYHSECIFVNRQELWLEILGYYAGKGIANK